MTKTQHALRELVDLDRGMISRDVFVDDDIYGQEQEQIFARAWLFIGHESQVQLWRLEELYAIATSASIQVSKVETPFLFSKDSGFPVENLREPSR
jgi:hypothetical protein